MGKKRLRLIINFGRKPIGTYSLCEKEMKEEITSKLLKNDVTGFVRE
jgi:hypothetical protein